MGGGPGGNRWRLAEDGGQGLVEYGIILVLTVVVIVVLLVVFPAQVAGFLAWLGRLIP